MSSCHGPSVAPGLTRGNCYKAPQLDRSSSGITPKHAMTCLQKAHENLQPECTSLQSLQLASLSTCYRSRGAPLDGDTPLSPT